MATCAAVVGASRPCPSTKSSANTTVTSATTGGDAHSAVAQGTLPYIALQMEVAADVRPVVEVSSDQKRPVEEKT